MTVAPMSRQTIGAYLKLYFKNQRFQKPTVLSKIRALMG